MKNTYYVEDIRYAISKAMFEYGFDLEDVSCMAKKIGIPCEMLHDLLHKFCIISEDNFEKICEFLKPHDELKARWKSIYVIGDMNKVLFCNKCDNLEKRKSGSGYVFHCSKENKYFLNYTEKDIETNYCINGEEE